MRRLALAALTLVWVIPIVQGSRQPEQGSRSAASSQKTQKPAQAEQPTAEAIQAISSAITQANQQHADELKAAEAQKNQDIAIQGKLIKYTFWLVIVGVIQFAALIAQAIVFFCTLRTINRQTRVLQRQNVSMKNAVKAARDNAIAAKDGAEAALLNAQVMMRAERALVEVDLGEPSTHFDEYGVEASGSAPDDIFRYGINVTNHGRTVARIVSYEVWYDSFAADFDRAKFNCSTAKTIHILLGADKSATVGNIEIDALLRDWDSIQAKTTTGMLRIDVRYKDVFEEDTVKPHETSVIFRWDAQAEEPIRLPQYNVYT